MSNITAWMMMSGIAHKVYEDYEQNKEKVKQWLNEPESKEDKNESYKER